MPDRPNVLFLLSDEHSFRCLGHAGEPRVEPVSTPFFDDLHANGTTFDQTYCQMPLCTPSRLCMLTGKEQANCSAWGNSATLFPEHETLPEVLSAAGYDTCLQGKMHLGGDRQYVGFDDRPYGDLTGGTGHQYDPPTHSMDRGMAMRSRTADAGVTGIPESMLQEYTITRESIAWLEEQDGDDPWFLTASFSRPHFPLTAPRRYFERYWDPEADEPTGRLTDPKVGHEGDTVDHPMSEGMAEGFQVDEIGDEESQRARAAYFACVEFLDDILDEFLDELDRRGHLENTVVVYGSDHGELAGEHGMWWKHSWHEAAARVPFYVQTPAQRRGDAAAHTVETPVSMGDVYPTVCGLAGVDAPADLDCVDLSGTVETGQEPDRGPVFTDNLNPRWGAGTEFRMVRDGRYKYVGFRDAPEILFDVQADPLEQENLAPDAAGEDREALERLRALVDETVDFDAAEEQRLADAERQREEFELAVPDGTGNAYHLPDGRVVDADTPLYRPHIITEDADAAFSDFPGGDS
jgi:choline-sulfatase